MRAKLFGFMARLAQAVHCGGELGFGLVQLIGQFRIALLQVVPYTMLRSQFILKPEDAQTLNGLLGTEGALLAIFALLLWLKK